MTYPYHERDKVYAFLKQGQTLIDTLERIARGVEAHSPELQAAIASMTGATDLNRQYQAMTSFVDRARKAHMDRLISVAEKDFTAYVEVINPEEACTSKLHRFLGEKFMELEAGYETKTGISMPPGHAKDMWIETPVLMADGSTKFLGDVEVGDFVIGHSGYEREVLEVHDQGERPVMRVTTLSGRELYPHGEHPFLTPSGWVQAQYLKPGDVVAQQREFSIPNSSKRSLDEFILAGYMMAAGMVKGRINSRLFTIGREFRTDDPAIIDDIREVAKRLGFSSKYRKQAYYGQDIVTVRFEQKFEHWLKTQKLLDEHRHTMRIPAWVFKGSAVEIGAFIGAIFSMDASLVPCRNRHTKEFKKLTIRMRNEKLMHDLQRLLERLGARSTVDKRLVGNYNYEPTKFWTLSIYDAEDQFWLQRWMRIVGVSQKFWNEPITTRQFFDGRYAAEKIATVEHDFDVRETKCLTVDVDHSFLADGIVVHNSTYGSRLFPSWWMGKRENKKWLQAGHTQTFAEKEFGKKLRNGILEKAAYQKVFPNVGIRSASKDEIVLTNDCSYVVKGVGQGISGYRSNFNNIDDPYASRQDAMSPVIREKVWGWWSDDFRTRRLPGAGELIIVTRWHTDDVIGRLEQMIKDGEIKEPWEFINLPAFAVEENDALNRKINDILWPEFFTEKYLLDIKSTSTDEMWSALYQCNPVLQKGNILQREWINYYKQLPSALIPITPVTPNTINLTPVGLTRDPRLVRVDPPKSPTGIEILQKEAGDPTNPASAREISGNKNPITRIRTVVSVDSAETISTRADRSAIQVWILGSDMNHYLAHAIVGKYTFPQLIEVVENTAKLWGANVILCETKGAGQQYIQARTGHSPCPIIGYKPGQVEKSMRFDGTMIHWQTQSVLIPERAPWLADYIDELLRFPSGRYDDQVDATSQYLNWATLDGGWRRGMKKVSS